MDYSNEALAYAYHVLTKESPELEVPSLYVISTSSAEDHWKARVGSLTGTVFIFLRHDIESGETHADVYERRVCTLIPNSVEINN